MTDVRSYARCRKEDARVQSVCECEDAAAAKMVSSDIRHECRKYRVRERVDQCE